MKKRECNGRNVRRTVDSASLVLLLVVGEQDKLVI